MSQSCGYECVMAENGGGRRMNGYGSIQVEYAGEGRLRQGGELP
jgi:hypothetical protein